MCRKILVHKFVTTLINFLNQWQSFLSIFSVALLDKDGAMNWSMVGFLLLGGECWNSIEKIIILSWCTLTCSKPINILSKWYVSSLVIKELNHIKSSSITSRIKVNFLFISNEMGIIFNVHQMKFSTQGCITPPPPPPH